MQRSLAPTLLFLRARGHAISHIWLTLVHGRGVETICLACLGGWRWGQRGEHSVRRTFYAVYTRTARGRLNTTAGAPLLAVAAPPSAGAGRTVLGGVVTSVVFGWRALHRFAKG